MTSAQIAAALPQSAVTTIDNVPFPRIASGKVREIFDASADIAGDGDAVLELSTVLAWEEKHGAIPEGSVVLLRTGWEDYYESNPEKGKAFPLAALRSRSMARTAHLMSSLACC